MTTLLEICVIVLGGVAFGFEAIDVELLELCHVAQSFRYNVYVPSHFFLLELVFPIIPRCTRCPIREVKFDGVPLKGQQCKINQIYIFFVRSKLPKIDENHNLCSGYSGRGFGMDLSIRTEYCPVKKPARIACKFVVREYWGDHEAVDVIAKLSRKLHQGECRSIMSFLSLHGSGN